MKNRKVKSNIFHYDFLMKNRKGELTTQQIVGLIILIVSFVVILVFILRLNLGETSDKEICHNSVALKGQSKLVSGPLDCKTSYVCISGGENCGEFNPSVTRKIDLEKEKIFEAIAEEMADCWWMFGEGKADYVGLDLESATIGEVNCALCSIISFDKEVQEFMGENVKISDFYNYVNSLEKESGRSYLYYLYGTQNIEEFNKLFKINFEESFDFSKQYSIVTGIGKLGALKATANWLASAFDAFNLFLSITPKFKNYGVIPVTLKEKSKINDLKCEYFLTKA